MIKPEFKIIADHLRSSSFLIADGVLPSNEGRGYVLRRIMRRAMLQLHKIGVKTARMHELVKILVDDMQATYQELSRAEALIVKTLKDEEEKFRETLDKGLEILEEEISKQKNKKISGKVAFKLYDTYGFPLDLTIDICKSKNIEIDVLEFEKEMEEQKKRARKNWVGSGEEKDDNIFFELEKEFGKTKFLGYEALNCDAKVLFISKNQSLKNFIILDQTTFYATSGGQKGDDGKIVFNQNVSLEITETKKFANGLFVHFFEGECQFDVGKIVSIQVNSITRKKKACNHSATHLLQKSLKEILGETISQKGSNVDATHFTFDFNFNRPLTKNEIERIEDLVNFYIQKNSTTKIETMPLEEAYKIGAEALFGEKYSDDVRVVTLNPSIELCGGTHVNATGDIGVFKIVSEKGIASGVRRIEAITGEEVLKYDRNKDAESSKKYEELLQILRKKEKEIEALKKEIVTKELQNLKIENLNYNENITYNFISKSFDNVDNKVIRECVNDIRNKQEFISNTIFAFLNNFEGKSTLLISVSKDLSEKLDAKKILASLIGEGKFGGNSEIAVGGISFVDKNFFTNLKNIILKI